MSKFKPRVFLGNDSRPYMAKVIDGFIWIYYLHPDNRWVTLKKIDLQKSHLITDNLTEFEQSTYPQFKD